jgi:predicted phosphodiesterase
MRPLRAITLFALGCAIFAAAPRSNFKFVILGDRTSGVNPKVYEEVWREIDAWRPDFVINVGDTIQGGNDATAAREWQAMKPLFDKYSRYPLYLTPGNHDIWSEASRRVWERETGRPAHYSFDHGDAHFVVLDNSRTESLSDEEMAFLTADLEKHNAARLKLIFFHKPFWLVPVMMRGDFPLHRLALQHHVTYIVSGHAHRFARFEHGGIVYLMVGSSGAHPRGSGFEEGAFYHHVRATVSGGRVQMTIKEADAPFGKGRSFTEQEWGSGPVMQSAAAAK